MGRAMIIICAGVLVSLGYVSFGTNQQAKQVIGANAGYAEIVQAKNAARTGIQMTMQEMNKDTTWRDNHKCADSNYWTNHINGSDITICVEIIEEAATFWDPDIFRIISEATYFDPVTESEKETKVVSIYKTNAIDEYVPDFKSALTFASNNVSVQASGSASISGYDPNGGQCEDKPAVSVQTDNTKSKINDPISSIYTEGDGIIKTDPSLDYEPTDEMIARLKESGNYTQVEGTYKGNFGTATEPGVFFVESDAKLSGGIEEGYGILVIRSGGAMEMDSTTTDNPDGDLSVAGNFTFNGLVVFENAYSFDGKGTPTINGSVLVGHTDEYWDQCTATKPEEECDIDVDLNGNIHMQYDCRGEDIAKQAAALAIKQRRYRRMSTFE